MMEGGGYFAILPASIRHDKKLSADEKLLYAEISTLINMNGVCFASDEYFAEVYGASIRSIQRRMNKLKTLNHITSKLIIDKETKKVKRREIRLKNPYDKSVIEEQKPYDKSVVDINTLTESNKKYIKKDFVKPTIEEINEYIKEHGYAIDAEHFYEYYEASNWMRNGKRIKSWKQSLVTWNRNANKNRSTSNNTDTSDLFAANFEGMKF